VFLSSRVAIMSARPGRVTRLVDVDLPRPRGLETRESPAYFSFITEVREALRGSEGPEADLASAERTAAEGLIG
jgi:NitT/TauT family transport system ATP-binding protein